MRSGMACRLIAQYVWYCAQEKTPGERTHQGIIAKRTPRPNHQGRGVLFVVEGTDPRLQPLPAGLNVLDKLQSIEVLGRVQGRIQGNN